MDVLVEGVNEQDEHLVTGRLEKQFTRTFSGHTGRSSEKFFRYIWTYAKDFTTWAAV